MSAYASKGSYASSDSGVKQRVNHSGPPPQIPYPNSAGGAPPPPGFGMHGHGAGYAHGPNYQGGGYAVARVPQSSNTFRKHIIDYFTNQKVQVNVVGQGWLVGFVVAVVNIAKTITGSRVKVRYVKVNAEEEEDYFSDDPNHIRPYN
ncbi:hypothetical protein CPC08DRAFT_706172 [Agrocybe pediades]|nr:hypothetical protein CPC08DRAFT_706172 [Agrocybe pediades]